MATLRLALNADDSDVLAGVVMLSPDAFGDAFACDNEVSALRDAVERVRRLILLRELAEHGELVIERQDAQWRLDWLWVRAVECHDCAQYDRGVAPRMATNPEHCYVGHSLEESEAMALAGAEEAEREAEVFARLLDQLGGGDV